MGMRGVPAGGHLRNLVSCRRPWAAQLLVYEANQKLHVPKAKRRPHYCWETLGGRPAVTLPNKLGIQVPVRHVCGSLCHMMGKGGCPVPLNVKF